jgi:D-aminopeptidase
MVPARLVGLNGLLITRSLSALMMLGPVVSTAQEKPRARDLGIVVGTLKTGPANAITDVPGVTVGHRTVATGDSINTGITAILPHRGNLFLDRVPASIHVINGFGKLLGIAQAQELGELETPILLTCTLCVWRAADALAAHLLAGSGMGNVRSINVVVGETNDGGLNDIRSRPIADSDVVAALQSARSGPVAEGSVGAGRGTIAFGWKGGIGTSSRVVRTASGADEHTLGVLVQSNFGGDLTIIGAPVGRELSERAIGTGTASGESSGSIMIVVATDAPLSSADLDRLAKRAVFGLARTGASGSSGSGDFVIAFSTAESSRRRAGDRARAINAAATEVSGDRLNALFQAVADATEEAIYNSLFKAAPVTYRGRTIEALPVQQTLEILDKYGARRRIAR